MVPVRCGRVAYRGWGFRGLIFRASGFNIEVWISKISPVWSLYDSTITQTTLYYMYQNPTLANQIAVRSGSDATADIAPPLLQLAAMDSPTEYPKEDVHGVKMTWRQAGIVLKLSP